MNLKPEELVKALRQCNKHETGCQGCTVRIYVACKEILRREAANQIERDQKEISELRKEIEWKDMVIALAQRERDKAEAERDKLEEKVGQYRALIPSRVIPKED